MVEGVSVPLCEGSGTPEEVYLAAGLALRMIWLPTSRFLRAPSRDVNATLAPPVSLRNEYENDSSHPHDATPRAAKRDTTATSDEHIEVLPAAERHFEEVPDWAVEDWEQLVSPLATAWAERTGTELRIDSYCRDVALPWPKAYVRRAIGTLVDDLNAGRNIKNPGGLLAICA